MTRKTKRIFLVASLGLLIFLTAALSLPFVSYTQRIFAERLIQAQEDYQKRGGQISHAALDISSPKLGMVFVTCRDGVFALPGQRLHFSTPEVHISWSILRPSKLKIVFPSGGVLALRSSGKCCFAGKACLTLPVSWKNMRPQIAPLLSGSIYFSADAMEASFDKLLSYKAEGILLSFKKKTKSITPANGSAHQEEVLSTGVLVKRFGGYLGQLPLFEFRLKAEGFLSHPHQLLTGASSWKKAGGYLECEELVIEAGDLNVKVGGALTLTEGGQPENGALTVDLTQEGGVLKGIRRLTPFMMKGQGEEGKGEGGSHVLLPVTVHSGDWSIEDIPVFLDGKFCGESLKVLLSKLQEGKFTAD